MDNLKIGQMASIKELNYYDYEQLKVGDIGVIIGFKNLPDENEPKLITVCFDEFGVEHDFLENELDFIEQPIPKDVNPLIVQVPGNINFNYGEAKAYLINLLLEYQGAVFSDDSIDVAKKIVADLRSKQKQLDILRISAKKEYLSTFEKKEVLMKDLYNLFDGPINFIDGQIKGYEERKKASKKADITKLYNSLIGELTQYIPFEKIYNSKWENQSFKMKAVQEELESVIASTQSAINTISSMNSESVAQALERFKGDLSLSNAITYINNYESQKAAILEREKEKQAEAAERQKQAEIGRIRREEREKVLTEQKAEEEKQAAIEQAKRETEEKLLSVKAPTTPIDDELGSDDIEKAIFTVFATADELDQIEIYMNSIGVEFRRE